MGERVSVLCRDRASVRPAWQWCDRSGYRSHMIRGTRNPRQVQQPQYRAGSCTHSELTSGAEDDRPVANIYVLLPMDTADDDVPDLDFLQSDSAGVRGASSP